MEVVDVAEQEPGIVTTDARGPDRSSSIGHRCSCQSGPRVPLRPLYKIYPPQRFTSRQELTRDSRGVGAERGKAESTRPVGRQKTVSLFGDVV